MTAENQRNNVNIAAQAISPLGEDHERVRSHGNGLQVEGNYSTANGPECQKSVAIIRSVDKVYLHLSPLDP